MVSKGRALGGPSRNRRRAFTLFEVLLSVIAIAILSSIGVTVARNVMAVSREAAAVQLREEIFAAQTVFRMNFAGANDAWEDAFGTDDKLELLFAQNLLTGDIDRYEKPTGGFEITLGNSLLVRPTLSHGDYVIE